MSFSYDTKNELCRLPVQKLCCARAEAYGILLFCNTFSATEVRIITENPHFAARLPKLFRRAFNLQFDRQPEPEQEEGKRIFQITDQKKLDHIINLLGFDPQQNLVLHINFGMVEETCDRAAFLRGAFFAGGSITDPQKRYHLELTTSHLQVSRELGSLLQECGYPPKSLSRGGSLITYFKQSDQIEDFLTLIGAPVAAMNVMSAKLEKDLRNSVNRRLNCDSANLDKAVEAAQEQMEAIRRLQAAELLEQLPDKLQETAALRLEKKVVSDMRSTVATVCSSTGTSSTGFSVPQAMAATAAATMIRVRSFMAWEFSHANIVKYAEMCKYRYVTDALP